MRATITRTAVVVASIYFSEGFVVHHPARLSRNQMVPHVSKGNAPLHMVIEPSSFMIASPLFSAAFAPAMTPLDPFLEAELFQDAAHFALDFASLLGPATVAIRALAVIGRIFVMASDYVPDHAMMPEELLFQMAMLCISSATLARSVAPAFTQKELTMRDRKSYASLFRPSGVTWMQYKFLSNAALEWVEVTPGAIITTDEMTVEGERKDLFWLYKGQVDIQSMGERLQQISSKRGLLLGDLSFASPTSSRSEYPKTTVKAGTNGATLLRIDTVKLKSMMKNDDSLDRAIRNMILDAMHARIASLLSSKNQV
ncbi:hypothetical protein MHU86_18042 [Fragilaria crotonensis]|nr:hypothetical protein MHU86_18042 [Fragilaria crotonensis]